MLAVFANSRFFVDYVLVCFLSFVSLTPQSLESTLDRHFGDLSTTIFITPPGWFYIAEQITVSRLCEAALKKAPLIAIYAIRGAFVIYCVLRQGI